MQVISFDGHKELRSRHKDQLKDLRKEYVKLGAQTQLTIHDDCNRIWSLIVMNNDYETNYFNHMGENYRP